MKEYSKKESLRHLSDSEARNLKPGFQHYTAYVGPPEQYDFMGATQFRLLSTLGLRANHLLLDLGCGSLRAGRFLIAYLERGHYFGIEPNRWLIEDAIQHQVGQALIDLKAPTFSDASDFSATRFGVDFDFIVAQSIFSHTGPELVSLALGEIKKALKPTGLVLATFIYPEQLPRVAIEAPGWSYPKCTTYRPQRILDLINHTGLVGRPIPWYHPRQTWYAIAHNPSSLPQESDDPILHGAILRDQDLALKVTP